VIIIIEFYWLPLSVRGGVGRGERETAEHVVGMFSPGVVVK